MVFYTLIGALTLLDLASGQYQSHGFPPGHDGDCGFQPMMHQHGHRFPPLKANHGLPRPVGHRPTPPSHHGLRHRNMADGESKEYWETVPPISTQPPTPITPRFDCGESPLARQEDGCPCFELETLTGQMDLKSADYCDFFASKPVDESDPCKHLYPPSYAYFSASAPYTGEEMFDIFFGVVSHYDPDMEGGYCSGEIRDYIFVTDTDSDTGEAHSYFLGVELTEAELDACMMVFEDLKKKLGDNPNCMVQIGGDSYYY